MNIGYIWPTLTVFIIFLFSFMQYSEFYNFNDISLVYNQSIDDDNTSRWKCQLPESDPWDPTIRRFLDRNSHPMRNCMPTAYQMTDLIDGQLKIINKSLYNMGDTRYRCLYPKDDSNYVSGDWLALNGTGARPECDIVEIETLDKSGNETTYQYLHSQVYSIESPIQTNNSNWQPSIFIIVLDSTSSSEAMRSLSETMQLLNVDYEAISFRHLNKIGVNSWPNAHAMFTGKRVDPIGMSLYGKSSMSDSEKPKACEEYLDNSTFFGNYFHGYKSLMAEDWELGVFNWPNCRGFQRPPTTHYMRPFQLRTGMYKSEPSIKLMRKTLTKSVCRESYEYVMEYVGSFLRVYPIETPKWSLIWLTDLAHDSVNGLYHVDGYFADFFAQYRRQLADSFVIVIGDHGIRWSGIRQTPIGTIEDNNPALTIALPTRLRTNRQLVDNIQMNARQLVSHYDVYATIIDVALFAGESNFADNIDEKMAAIMGTKRGSSLLRRLPTNRNCETMQIPAQYCICETNRRLLKNMIEYRLVKNMANYLVNQLNQIISIGNVTDQCAPLVLQQVEKVEVIEHKNQLIYNIRFSVQPSNGTFESMIANRLDNSSQYELMSDSIVRVNGYDSQGDCVKNKDAILRPICYCRPIETISDNQKVPFISNGNGV